MAAIVVVEELPPYLRGHNITKFNSTTVSQLTPMVQIDNNEPVTAATVNKAVTINKKRPKVIMVQGLPDAMMEATGVLVPLERMPCIGAALRRLKIDVDYSLVVSLPVDRYERPLPVGFSADPSSTQTLPFIFLPHENPSLLHRHIRSVTVTLVHQCDEPMTA